MAYALIDNATLTAAQRVLGEIETLSRDSTDVDIVALENLIQSILFYDDLICIDDYKTQYGPSRKKRFEFIRFLNPVDFSLDEIEAASRSEAQKTTPKINGGEFVDRDFKEFFKQLKMNVTCTWDLSSSIYYLTLKMLGSSQGEEFQKYGKISAAIFNELNDKQDSGRNFESAPELIDSNGANITESYIISGAHSGGGRTGGMSGALSAFVASLSWLSYRTVFYMYTARYLKADVFLHPTRQAFQINLMQKNGVYGYDFTKSLIDRMGQNIQATVPKIISSDRAIATNITLPVFSAWLVMQSGNVKGVLDSAKSIRNEAPIKEVRELLKSIRIDFDGGDLQSANKKIQTILDSLEKASKDLVGKYGLKTPSGFPLSNPIKVFNGFFQFAGFEFPEIDLTVKVPQIFKDAIPSKGFSALYRDIGRDLSKVWALGEARDKLGASVRLIDEGEKAYSPKAEEPRFKRAHSSFKSPM